MCDCLKRQDVTNDQFVKQEQNIQLHTVKYSWYHITRLHKIADIKLLSFYDWHLKVTNQPLFQEQELAPEITSAVLQMCTWGQEGCSSSVHISVPETWFCIAYTARVLKNFIFQHSNICWAVFNVCTFKSDEIDSPESSGSLPECWQRLYPREDI